VKDPSLRKLTEVVYLAGQCADVFVDEEPAQAIADVRKFCLETHKMSQEDCDQMMAEICTSTQEVAPLFEINIGANTSYDNILRKANEALVDLTLRSQQQATSLAAQNEQLHRRATMDALTSLANRATFDEYIREKFVTAVQEGEPISMLMLDIDKFKSINDTHGHQTGDLVLQHVAKIMKAAARPQDIAARYGGEELTLVLPGTPRAIAAAIAETICRAIAARSVRAGAKTLNITASLGVATYEVGGIMREATHLIKAADMAVYAAKHSGRNCVRVFTLPTKAAPKPAAA
jgi:diguanylate cyclase (GGDEF)-like protein